MNCNDEGCGRSRYGSEDKKLGFGHVQFEVSIGYASEFRGVTLQFRREVQTREISESCHHEDNIQSHEAR